MQVNRRGFLGALAATAGVSGAVSMGRLADTEARIHRAFFENVWRMLAPPSELASHKAVLDGIQGMQNDDQLLLVNWRGHSIPASSTLTDPWFPKADG